MNRPWQLIRVVAFLIAVPATSVSGGEERTITISIAHVEIDAEQTCPEGLKGVRKNCTITMLDQALTPTDASANATLTFNGATQATIPVPIVIEAANPSVCPNPTQQQVCGVAMILGEEVTLMCHGSDCQSPGFTIPFGFCLGPSDGDVIGVELVPVDPAQADPVGGEFTWGSWNRQVTRTSIAGNNVALEWTIAMDAPVSVPIAMGTVPQASHGDCSTLNYVDCPSCCEEACSCKDSPYAGYFIDSIDRADELGFTVCNSRPLGGPCGQASNGTETLEMRCDDMGRCITPPLAYQFGASLGAGEPFSVYLTSGPISFPETQTSDDGMVVTIQCVESAVYGDLSGNGVTSLEDFPFFLLCFEGPGVAADTLCDCADLNGDSRVDLADAALLLSVIE